MYITQRNIIENTNKKLNSLYNKNKNNNLTKNKIFNFANYTDFNNIKVVILDYLVFKKLNKHCETYMLTTTEYTDEKRKYYFCFMYANSLNKLDLIDKNKHKIIISSHPSLLSVNKLRN